MVILRAAALSGSDAGGGPAPPGCCEVHERRRFLPRRAQRTRRIWGRRPGWVTRLAVRVLFEGQGEVFGLGAGAGSFFEGGVAAVEWVFGLMAVHGLLDGEDLDAGIGGTVGRGVEASLSGFAEHGFGGFFEAEEDADFGFFAFQGAAAKFSFSSPIVSCKFVVWLTT